MLSVVAEPVYLSRPLSLAEMTADQLQRAADQLREFALSELAFIEHQLTEVAPLRADAFGDWERKQAKLAELQAEKWQWLGLSLGLVEAVLVAWPWGYVDRPPNIENPINKQNDLESGKYWKPIAWKIGKAWMLEQEAISKKRPTRDEIGWYLEGRLFELGIEGPHGRLTAENIIREALRGITKD